MEAGTNTTTTFVRSCTHCARCGQEFVVDDPGRKQSYTFSLVCQGCSDHAGRVTARQNRRCKRKGVYSRLTRFDWLAVEYKHGFACACCGVSSREEMITLDHVIPLSEGGTNCVWNIQPLCVTCHRDKDDMKPLEEVG